MLNHKLLTLVGGLLAAILLCPQGIIANSEIHFFDGPDAPRSWSGTAVSSVSPEENIFAGHTGLTLPLPLQRLDSRAYWDASVRLDLEPFSAISFDVQIDNPNAVKRASIYFRSGDGWYGGWFELEGSSWQTITLSRSDFQPEGSPAGWDHVNTIRIAFWKENGMNTRAQMAHFRAHNVPILILRNTAARETKPEDADFADRLTDRLLRWLQQYGIAATVITDDDLKTSAPPSGTKLVILPYNPVVEDSIHKRLETFTSEGGKLLVAYALDDKLATLLDLDGWQWMAAERSDAFAFMHFLQPEEYALPARVAQDSWNINRPLPADARVLATWMNSSGEDSQIPAVTLGSHGVFLGHVLTNTGREEKMRMLVALIAKLAPELTPQLASIAITQATTLIDYSDWESVSAFISSTAQRHRRTRRVRSQLRSIEQSIERLQEERGTLSYAQTAVSAHDLRSEIQSAFHASFSSRNATRDEFRGVWAHYAEGVRGIPWTQTMETLSEHGMNNIFANVLWAGAAFYPSDVLPNQSPRNDYACEIIEAAEKHNIRTHAWIVLWSLQHAPEDFIESMRTENRLQANHEAEELPWLCPSHPDNRELTTQAATEVIKRYAFDGFHVDYIRYPDSEACFCNGCKERFENENEIRITDWPQAVKTGPHQSAWLGWRREIIDTMMKQLYQSVKDVNEDVLVSAAVWPNWPSVRDSIAQDWPKWAEQGWIDFFTPMSYVNSAAEAKRFYRSHRDAVPSNIPIYPGIAPSTKNLSPATMLHHIDALREAGAPGFVLFDLDRDLLDQHLPAFGSGAARP